MTTEPLLIIKPNCPTAVKSKKVIYDWHDLYEQYLHDGYSLFDVIQLLSFSTFNQYLQDCAGHICTILIIFFQTAVVLALSIFRAKSNCARTP
jgi:hypothetical protein